MKKCLGILLALTLSFGLTSCGGNSSPSSEPAPESSGSTAASQAQDASSEETGGWEWERDIEMVCMCPAGQA